MKRKTLLLALLLMICVPITLLHAETPRASLVCPLKLDAPLEGYFYHDNYTGKIYWYVAGQLHHIESWNSFIGLFSNPEAYLIRVSGIATVDAPVGVSLTEDNGLVVYLNTTVFLRIKTHLYHIHSATEFNFYHFNWSNIRSIPSTASYNIVPSGFGPNMTWL